MLGYSIQLLYLVREVDAMPALLDYRKRLAARPAARAAKLFNAFFMSQIWLEMTARTIDRTGYFMDENATTYTPTCSRKALGEIPVCFLK